ncbi:hypothetical protein [Dictyobacter formicarum]|uniref:Uncharacterized protein n=1 Tax=Dictyobacter formicarum TaxID=2778368 RepID=A0ABQ3VU45_9CHLR|nr:hypothetical protein [Dictyobacter formicarum]GHO89154.1 hypothetical protein KSZ_71600 [Dictyobacter formicarum]
MGERQDEVLLGKGVKRWPVERAEALLASPLPWGPPTYALGIGYVDDPKLGDQAQDFMGLAMCVDGAYNRHGNMGQAWKWANPILRQVETRTSYEGLSTQDLLDVVFLSCRGERFSDGLIRQRESLLRAIIQEVVRRICSDAPPVFIVQKSDTTENR